MDVAAERLAYAVRHGETVGVFGDYDVDGACSAALMVTLLRQLGCTVLHHVPDRMMEGYGPNGPALHSLVLRGASLIVCVDCGTAAAEALGFIAGDADIVVLDHHKAEGPPPAIVATVNPNRLDCTSGLSMLCAAAVAFLTAVATVRTLRRQGFFNARKEPDLIGLLDLVALATVCDVMPLTGRQSRAGLPGPEGDGAARAPRRRRAARRGAGARAADRRAPAAIALGPRINAAGRITEADLGLRLLLCEDPVEAASLAATLDAVNRQRQEVEAAMLDACDARGRGAGGGRGMRRWWSAAPAWHPGVVGIVAGRIKERFNRPACVAGIADGLAKGSGRSVAGLDLGAAVIAARQAGILKTGGGHPMAAGFSLAAGAAGGVPCVPRRTAGRRGGAADRGRSVGGGHAGGARRDDGAGAAAGAAGAVRRRQRGADAGAAARPRGACRSRRPRRRRDPRVRRGRGRRAAAEGDAVPRARRGVGGGVAGGERVPLHLAGHLRAEEWNGAVNPGFFIADAALDLADSA